MQSFSILDNRPKTGLIPQRREVDALHLLPFNACGGFSFGDSEMKKIKTIRGYSANARFWAETGDFLGFIPSKWGVGSQYSYSPTQPVYDWNGKRIIQAETAGRRYEVFELPEGMSVFPAEDDAERLQFEAVEV